jgi:hypothetical protein
MSGFLLFWLIIYFLKRMKAEKTTRRHEQFPAYAAPLISARSRELTRKTGGFKHTPTGGLCSLLQRKLLYRLALQFSSALHCAFTK